jgi:hypothetical protein
VKTAVNIQIKSIANFHLLKNIFPEFQGGVEPITPLNTALGKLNPDHGLMGATI